VVALSSDSIALLFKAKGDTDDAKKAFSDLRSHVNTEVDAIAQKGSSKFGEFAQSMGLSDASATKLTASLGALGVGLGAIVAVMTAEVAIAVTVVAGLFSMAKAASDAGSQIKDMQDKTGLAATTLSTLKLNADSAGSSFEQVGGGIEKFTKLLGQAADGNDKAKATLKELNVDTTNLDDGLKQVIKTIADAQDGTEQITLAQKAFGKSGADLIPVIKQMSGDLAAAEKEAERLGTTLTDADAKAADDLGDSFTVLSSQVSTAVDRFALQYAPQITAAIQRISEFLANNQHVAVVWGKAVSDVVKGLGVAFDSIALPVTTFFDVLGIKMADSQAKARVWAEGILLAINPVLAVMARVGSYVNKEPEQYGPYSNEMNRGKKTSAGEAEPSFINPGDKGYPSLLGDFNKKVSEDAKKAEADAKKAIEDRRREREKAYQEEIAAQSKQTELKMNELRAAFTSEQQLREDQFIKGEKTAEQYRSESLAALQAYSKTRGDLIAQQETIDLKGKKGTARTNVSTIADNAISALNREVVKEQADIEKNITETVDKETKKQVQVSKKGFEERLALARSNAATQIDVLKNELQIKAITEKQFEEKASKERIAVLNQELAGETDATRQAIIRNQIRQEELQLQNKLVDIETKSREETEKKTKALQDQIEEFDKWYEKWTETQAKAWAEEEKRKQAQEVEGAGGGLMSGIIDGLGTTVDDMMKKVEPIKGIGNIIGSQFNLIAQGVGNAVKSFVLLGSAGGSFKKFAAEVLASIAQMAIVQAVWELAQGFAMLALSWFTGNPKYGASAGAHFTAAAIYGIVGGIAAIAGRVTAGDSFKQESSGAFGTAPSSSGGGQGSGSKSGVFSSNEDQVIDSSRNAPGGMRQEVVVTINDKSDWFAQMFQIEMRKNGAVRQAVLDAG